MPNGKYDFDYDEPVSLPLDPEDALRGLLNTPPVTSDDDEDSDA